MGGRNRFEVIKSMIAGCPYFLVVLTKDGIRSQWVNQEIGYAVARNKNLIPIIEIENFTARRFDSKGFVELHDPINYYRNNEIQLMAYVNALPVSLSLNSLKARLTIPCVRSGFLFLLDI